jgi:hypothetical protein
MENETDSQICVVGNNDSILSNKSPIDMKPRFTLGSFTFQQIDACIKIFMSPIFIWKMVQRVIKCKECEINYTRLRTFASFYMKKGCNGIQISVNENNITYTVNDKIKSIQNNKYYSSLSQAYNLLYLDIEREHNTRDKVTDILNECYDILVCLSKLTI